MSSQPRTQALSSIGRKDPGRSWSRVTSKTVSLTGCRESVKLHASTTVNCVIIMLNHVVFLYCLEFAIQNSFYKEIVLKPKQVRCLESIYLQTDVMCVLPTGYGKSLIFHLLSMILFAKFKLQACQLLRGCSAALVDAIVIVVSPLNSLMNDQLSKLQMSGIRASVLNVKVEGSQRDEHEWADVEAEDHMNVDIDFGQCEEKRLRDGHYHIVFAHPETLISSKYGREL